MRAANVICMSKIEGEFEYKLEGMKQQSGERWRAEWQVRGEKCEKAQSHPSFD